MKHCLAAALLFVSLCCTAQSGNRLDDGHWLKRGLDAYERATVTRIGSTEDAAEALALLAFVRGALGVHLANNLQAMTFIGLTRKHQERSNMKELPPDLSMMVKMSLAFAPLIGLPSAISIEQVLAILRRHLSENPEKWGEDAHVLLTEALQKSFPPSKIR